MRHAALIMLRRDHPHFAREFARRSASRIARPGASMPSSLVSNIRSSTRTLRFIVRALFDAFGPRRPAWRKGRRRSMQIIDAQVHIWGSGKPSGHHRQTSIYTAEELIKEMDAAGVNGAVLHPPSWDQRLERNGCGGREEISRQVLHPRLVPARQARGAQADRDVEAATRHAGPALVVDAARAGELAHGRHDGLAVASGGTRRHADRDNGLALSSAVQPDRRAASKPEADHRPPGSGAVSERRRRRSSIWMRCVRWRSVQMSQSRRQARRVIPPRRIHSAISTTGCIASSMRTGRSGSSGAPISPACRAAIVSA